MVTAFYQANQQLLFRMLLEQVFRKRFRRAKGKEKLFIIYIWIYIYMCVFHVSCSPFSQKAGSMQLLGERYSKQIAFL